jgi:hypothetical protein
MQRVNITSVTVFRQKINKLFKIFLNNLLCQLSIFNVIIIISLRRYPRKTKTTHNNILHIIEY